MLIRTALALMLLTFPAPAPAGSALPRGFVYLRDIDPTIVQDIRYAGSHNFVGRPIKGYLAAECILSASAAAALAKIQKMLAGKKLSLIVWDCYRPMRAVDDFLRWSRDPAVARGATAPLARGATAPHADMKAEFYPRNDKKNLFALGYLAPRSAHSRGSTVDLGLVPSGSAAAPPPDPSQPLKACTSPKGERFEDGTIDLGTGYDCLDALGRTSNALAGATALHHRQMLKSAMREAGFRPYFREWWHFQLNDEPFHRGFDFEVSASPATANSR
jgi:D-alanyl-D-alanine dipeptidase